MVSLSAILHSDAAPSVRLWLGDGAPVAERGGVYVAADATLYDRPALASALRAGGQPVAADAPAAEQIAACYRAFGAEGLLRLNGDVAFMLWDAGRRLLFLGRDFAATRPLHYAVHDRRLLVASSIDDLLELRGSRPEFDLLGLAEAASGLVDAGGRSCWSGVHSVPPGCVLVVDASLCVREAARWSAPTFETGGGSATSFTDAAMELRDVLRRAVTDRMSPDVTAVWMSGGYDSSSVFASARSALGREASGRVETISVSYPVGDGGREDEIIERILAHHGATGRWIDGGVLPLLGDVAADAPQRDQPFAAMYNGFFRSAAREARAAGAHVALSGHGGDVLFDSSLVYFADLFGGLHLSTYLAEWRLAREAMWRPAQILEETFGPLVPEPLARKTLHALGKRKEREHLPAAWLRRDVASRIADSGWMPLDRRRGESRTSAVARWSLGFPFFTKSQEAAAAAARAEGVEYRMPLLDPRVLALAATRPRWEKRRGAHNKSLLRAAMKGMLPEDVLLPRLYKTGLTQDYLLRCLQREFPTHASALRRESVLGDLGIIDPSRVVSAVNECAHDRGGWVAGQLYFTFQTEYWLRGRMSSEAPARTTPVIDREPSLV
jgi:asparagine synthase (glutamine-hydrolysing)